MVKVAVPVGRMVCGPVVGKVCPGIEGGATVEVLSPVPAEGVVGTTEGLILIGLEGLEFCVPDGLVVPEALGKTPDTVDPERGTVNVIDPDVMTV